MRIRLLLSLFQLAKLIQSMGNVQPQSGQDIKKRTIFGVMVLNIFNAVLNRTSFFQVCTVP